MTGDGSFQVRGVVTEPCEKSVSPVGPGVDVDAACAYAFAPTGLPRVYWCSAARTWAARTDYLMWWANRLVKRAQACGSRWDAFMAIVCARTAVAAITQLSGILVHEFSHHLVGTGGHCFGDGEPLDCCHDKGKEYYIARMSAILGLPHPNESEPGRFASFQWEYEKEGDCGGKLDYRVTHCGVLKRGRGHTIAFDTKPMCVPEGYDASPTFWVDGGGDDCELAYGWEAHEAELDLDNGPHWEAHRGGEPWPGPWGWP